MELKHFFSIFVKYKVLFWGVVGFFILIGVLFFFLQKEAYKASVSLNVTRAGSVDIAQYQYDDFYRLQADERFADTVVQWVKSARFHEDIFRKTTSRLISAKRLSSQVIEVKIVSGTPQKAKKSADMMLAAINKSAEQLNEIQRQDNWFVVQSVEPVVHDNRLQFHFLLILSIALGAFFAFWIVLLRSYLDLPEGDNKR